MPFCILLDLNERDSTKACLFDNAVIEFSSFLLFIPGTTFHYFKDRQRSMLILLFQDSFVSVTRSCRGCMLHFHFFFLIVCRECFGSPILACFVSNGKCARLLATCAEPLLTSCLGNLSAGCKSRRESRTRLALECRLADAIQHMPPKTELRSHLRVWAWPLCTEPCFCYYLLRRTLQRPSVSQTF